MSFDLEVPDHFGFERLKKHTFSAGKDDVILPKEAIQITNRDGMSVASINT